MPRGVYPRTEEHKRKIAEKLRGHSVSDETRKKLSEAHAGRAHSEEHRRKNSEGVSRSWTPERRQELSERMIEYFADEEVRKAHGRRGMLGTEPARGWSIVSGYRILSGQQDHPLATGGQGNVFEHRMVLYDVIGSGPHECHWCGETVEWGGFGQQRLVPDHLDGDKLNNDPANLVPSCDSCNQRRSRAGNPVDWTPPETVSSYS